MLKAKWEMDARGGVVIANPVPEEFQMDADLMEKTITEAVAEADRLGIRGKRITPFLLAKIEKLTGGRSLETNIQLALNNARLGAAVAGFLSPQGFTELHRGVTE